MYFLEEIIDFLKKKDYSPFFFRDGHTHAEINLYVNDKADYVEVFVRAHNNMILDKTADWTIDVLEHLEECIQRAYVWLSKQNLCDRWLTKPAYSPQELEQLFTICELDIEEAGSVLGNPKPSGGVFVMRFAFEDTKPMNPYPWHHDIYFDCDDLQPYMSEKDLW